MRSVSPPALPATGPRASGRPCVPPLLPVELRRLGRCVAVVFAVAAAPFLLAASALSAQEPPPREAACDPEGGFRTEARLTGTVTRLGPVGEAPGAAGAPEAAAGAGVPGAIVEVRALAPGGETVLDRARARADSLGRFTLCDLPTPARFEVLARTDDAASRVLSFDWEGGSDLEIALEVRPGAATGDLEETLAELREGAGESAGRIVGRVRDRATGRPVTSATVVLGDGMGSAASDGQGRFVLPEVLPGRHRLAVRHLGYAEVSETVEVPARRTVDVDIRLSADPVELEPLVVTTVRERRLEMRGFYERKRWGERLGLGHFFTREEIERRSPHNLSHMIADLPGARIDCSGNARMKSDACAIGFSRIADCRQANVYLDGAPVIETLATGEVWGSLAFDELVTPVEVEAVEVYPGASAAPAEFGGSSGQCGVIVIWTR